MTLLHSVVINVVLFGAIIGGPPRGRVANKDLVVNDTSSSDSADRSTVKQKSMVGRGFVISGHF